MDNTENKTHDVKSISEEIAKLYGKYKEGYKVIEEEYKVLIKKQDNLPQKFVTHYDFESSVILASQLKHRAIQLFKNSMGLYGSVAIDLDYIDAQLRLYVVEDYLRDKYDKITDASRNAYVISFKGNRELMKLKKKLEAVQDAADKLVRAFEGDEVNCRKFLEMKNKLKGL